MNSDTRYAEVISALTKSTLFRFVDWPNRGLPDAAVGLYAVWRDSEFVYIGMGGRVAQNRLDAAHSAKKMCGLKDRLDSHAIGRRSGDQFCVYVGDRPVLPTLTQAQIADIGAGRLKFDHLIRAHIRDRLAYRVFVFDGRSTDTQREARRVERMIQRGETPLGRPLLNPL